jgi:DNA polymerase-3 subunit gamma/tau
MTVNGTINHLKSVAEKESISYEEEALAVIAEKADGGMRDALSIFDQAASFCQGNITYQKVIEDLNVLDSENYFNIIDLSINNKVSDIMVLLNSVINKGFDGGLLIQGLAKHVRNVMMAKDPQTLPLLEVSDQQRERYQEQAKKADTRFLYQALRLMNQCDINYRQSSNKRLLVELTLIEIAQITQPDDGVSAGRSPKRLKSLFKNLIQQAQPKTAAPQVAAAKPVASPITPKETGSTPSKPATKLNGIGFSWGNLRNNGKGGGKMHPIPGAFDSRDTKHLEDMSFSQEDLELQWLSMCNRIPEKDNSLMGIASRMKNMNPIITDFPNIEVTVDNDLIKQDLEKIIKGVNKTLQVYLRNSKITLEIVVSDKPEKVKILTRREQFEEMSKENPAVEALRQVFDLDLV